MLQRRQQKLICTLIKDNANLKNENINKYNKTIATLQFLELKFRTKKQRCSISCRIGHSIQW